MSYHNSLNVNNVFCTKQALTNLGMPQYARYANVITASRYSAVSASSLHRVCVWHASGMHRGTDQVITLSVELGELFVVFLRSLTATVTHQRRWLERQDGYYSVLSTLVRGLQ